LACSREGLQKFILPTDCPNVVRNLGHYGQKGKLHVRQRRSSIGCVSNGDAHIG
jgi:hypothetical protein